MSERYFCVKCGTVHNVGTKVFESHRSYAVTPEEFGIPDFSTFLSVCRRYFELANKILEHLKLLSEKSGCKWREFFVETNDKWLNLFLKRRRWVKSKDCGNVRIYVVSLEEVGESAVSKEIEIDGVKVRYYPRAVQVREPLAYVKVKQEAQRLLNSIKVMEHSLWLLGVDERLTNTEFAVLGQVNKILRERGEWLGVESYKILLARLNFLKILARKLYALCQRHDPVISPKLVEKFPELQEYVGDRLSFAIFKAVERGEVEQVNTLAYLFGIGEKRLKKILARCYLYFFLLSGLRNFYDLIANYLGIKVNEVKELLGTWSLLATEAYQKLKLKR